MRVKNKILMVIVAGVAISTLMLPNKASAALQSNGGTSATKDLSTWMLQIRQMQELGGTLGRTDTINTTNLASNATDLDIHMEKNTEYGAMAILSASAYGNPNKINSGETTTGNSTGIVINLNKEWVVAGELTDVSIFTNAKPRYKNNYLASGYIAKIGDAMKETEGWHGASKDNKWLYYYQKSSNAGILRAYKDSLFSYYCIADTFGEDANSNKPWSSRACIVVGTGL